MDSMHVAKERHKGRDFRKVVMNFKISGQERIFDWIRNEQILTKDSTL
jgi:hypothetical protein